MNHPAESFRGKRVLITGGLREPALRLPVTRIVADHVFHQYVVRTPRRAALMQHLRAHGAGGLEETERACREILSLPMHPHLSDEAVDGVGEEIRHWNQS